jgi:adenylate kinase
LGGIIGVTGTPGTGKKSVAPLMASKLDLRCVGLNELSLSHGLAASSSPDSDVDPEELRRIVRREVVGRAVVYGHLVPYVFERRSVSKVLVLRCEPGVLKGRLLRRGYSRRKLIDNIEAELIGLLSSDAFAAFGSTKTFEVDTTYSTPTQAAETALGVTKGSRSAPPRIDWTTNYDTGAKLRLLLSTAVE